MLHSNSTHEEKVLNILEIYLNILNMQVFQVPVLML